MPYRYYTKVTFPDWAVKIPNVLQALESEDIDEVEETGDGTIQAICAECSYGEMDITDVLDEHKVPYDHYHQCADARHDEEGRTEYVRYEAGKRSRTQLFFWEEHEIDACQELLELLDKQGVEALRSRLVVVISNRPTPLT